VPTSDASDEAPVDQLNSDLLSPCGGICVSMNCWCGIEKQDDNREKWDVLRNTELASSQNGITNSQLARSSQG